MAETEEIYQSYVTYEEEDKSGLIELREEQKDAVKTAKEYFEKSKENQCFLWNAKMRFGKTFCAMELAIEMGESKIDPKGKKDSKPISRVLIITHKPVVQEGFATDLNKLQESLKAKGKLNRHWGFGTRSDKDNFGIFNDLEKNASEKNEPYVFFSSTQWLCYSKEVGGTTDDPLRKAILTNKWDLVVIDEAHEGILADRGSEVIAKLKECNPKMLYMSGTPFNLLDGTKTFSENQIYSWDYIEEQKRKNEWSMNHPGKTNPYQELPKMNIFAFNMGTLIPGKDYKKGDMFSFGEMFRTFIGRPEADIVDGKPYTASKEEIGKFVHEEDVKKFIKLLYLGDEKTNYPYTKEQYQENFCHTLWIVPGVLAAKALKDLLEKDELFGSEDFKIVNVAGNSEKDENLDDLGRVKEAIDTHPCTITISCAKLTTGVTVPAWTAVFYMKGSADSSTATYMQTIFRVQSPHVYTDRNGQKRMKANCYVFDFAPGRSIKVVVDTAKFARKIKTATYKNNILTQNDKEIIENFTNYCPIWQPVVAKEGSSLVKINTDDIISEINKVHTRELVEDGFDNNKIYLDDEILKLSDDIIQETKDINDNIPGESGKSKDNGTSTQISGNGGLTTTTKKRTEKQKLTEQQKWEKEVADGKTSESFDEWLERKDKETAQKEKLKNTRKLIHAITKRIPLLMFGAEVDDEKIGITIDNITERVDDASWTEFMPKGATKDYFKRIKHVYNDSMFKDAGTMIRDMARSTDEMHIEERIAKIAQIFSYFKNPDKETVLTQWPVVNRHMSDTLGGYCFYDETFKKPNMIPDLDSYGNEILDKNGNVKMVETYFPRFVGEGNQVTKDIFGNIDEKEGESRTHILEINSKTGLYPLYVAYSLYRPLLEVYKKQHAIDDPNNLAVSEEQAIWDTVIKNNIYVICNTDMAVRVTYRTLAGYRPISGVDKTTISSEHYIKGLHIVSEKLVEKATTNKKELIKTIKTQGYWDHDDNKEEMKFNAIVGNPPYQVPDSGNSNSATPIYNEFVELSKEIKPDYISLIMPARWFIGGKGLDDFRKSMLEDSNIRVIYDYPDYRELFPSAEIAGGVCYFHMDLNNNNPDSMCDFVSCIKGEKNIKRRKLNEFTVLVRDNYAPEIINEIKKHNINGGATLDKRISPRKPFAIQTNYMPTEQGTPCWFKQKIGKAYADTSDVRDDGGYLNKWKLLIPRSPIAGQTDFTKPIVFYGDNNVRIARPGECCAEVYLVACAFDSEDEVKCFKSYLFTKIVRYLLLQCVISQDVTRECFMFVPDLGNYTKLYSDEILRKEWGISDKLWKLIDSKIK